MTETNDDERLAAEALAHALEGLEGEGKEPALEDPELAELLRLTGRVRATCGQAPPLSTKTRDDIVERALEKASPRRRPRIYWIAGAVAAAFALAVLGFLFTMIPLAQQTQLPAHAFAAPTDSLFDGPFPEAQSPAERLDRIVQARTRGYFDAMISERRTSTPQKAVVFARTDETSQELGRLTPW